MISFDTVGSGTHHKVQVTATTGLHFCQPPPQWHRRLSHRTAKAQGGTRRQVASDGYRPPAGSLSFTYRHRDNSSSTSLTISPRQPTRTPTYPCFRVVTYYHQIKKPESFNHTNTCCVISWGHPLPTTPHVRPANRGKPRPDSVVSALREIFFYRPIIYLVAHTFWPNVNIH